MTCTLFAVFLAGVSAAFNAGPLQEQSFDYNKQAHLDAEGNVYVSSDEGKLIWMADRAHCSSVSEASDYQTFVCTVTQDAKPGEIAPLLQLEIYRKNGHKEVIEPGAPILDWHFSKDGLRIAVAYGKNDGPVTYALYDLATARVVDKLTSSLDESVLPKWAKSEVQIRDEAVPMSASLAAERTAWISKVIGQVYKIKPGMKRKDLLKLFTTEGGISNRTQRTYVYVDCPYIKVDVHFTALNSDSSDLNGDPDDVIESISRPYLAWTVSD